MNTTCATSQAIVFDHCGSTHGTERPLPPLSGHTQKKRSVHVCLDGILLSEEDAREVFDELRSDHGFVWEYIEDGCLARAHKMCGMLREKGIGSEKIRIENAEGTWLGPYELAVQKNDATGYVYMGFHVAVVVKVLAQRGIEERILDPTLFDSPVPQAVWARRFINRDALGSDGTVDHKSQRKVYRRFPHDVFEKCLFRSNKDKEMHLTNEILTAIKKKRSAALRGGS